MGEKITVDSATMMNKGLEVIEARWLFDVEPERIEVLVHPQSIVHCLVEYHDGSVVAVMAMPDMSIPVAYALAYPGLLDLGYLGALDLAATGRLDFEPPDQRLFPCLSLAFEALKAGGTMPAVANAANEVAVQRFLARDIGFTDIAAVIAATMRAHPPRAYTGVADVREADAWARGFARDLEQSRAIV
jgi:1-deoxy-D-xylulose-5-phosphate reductoisomerase